MMTVSVKVNTIVPRPGTGTAGEELGPEIEVRNDYSDYEGRKIVIVTPDGQSFKVEAEEMRQAVDRCAGVRY